MSTRPVRRNTDLRSAYFAAAHEILSTDGYGALKLAAVCKRLEVTTGSFYHSFDNWQEFTDALLDNWLEERTTMLVDIARSEADPVAKLQLLAQMCTELQHGAEAAIRVWSSVEPRVRSVQEKVDQDRYAIVHEAMVELVGDDLAPHYAFLGMTTLIGYEMLSSQFEAVELSWSLETILASAVAARAGAGAH